MRNRVVVVVVVLVVLVAAGAGGLWWYLRDDSPEKVTLDSARESVDTTTGSDTGTAGSTDPGDISGTWTVDTSTGDFDFESATGSFVGFRVQEELSSIGSTTAVGRTNAVTGTMTIDGTTVTDASFEVDLTEITTNESRRDGRVQDALETSQFPTATFTLTEPIELGDGATSGEELSVTAVGDLEIHGQTQPVEIPLEAQLVDGTVVVVGSLDLTFSDYGVETPSAPIVLSVDDNGELELQLLFTRS